MSDRPMIGLTGYAQSGKDTTGQYLVTMFGYERLAFADAVRSAVYVMNPIISNDGEHVGRLQDYVDGIGWDRAKVEVPEVRRLLQVMGTEVGRMLLGEDVWIEIVKKKASETTRPVVITDVRFANEADFIRSQGGVVVRVDRPGVQALNTHASESLDFDVDHILVNADGIENLYDEVDSLLSYIA